MNKIILFFSSGFGTGYIKYAPGTFGTLLGVLLWAFFIPDKYSCHFLAIICIFAVSVFFSSLAEKIYGKKDDQRIVIDEVAGIWFSVAFLPKTLLFLSLGFVFFRFFDIKKPWFIKKVQNVKGGLGVTIDDILAGIFANIILQVLHIFIK
ncbi:MAG: phosphatidylglycerophosphatase A [Endomicrobia bacterium]|nr:phosphatidylglycerophosphatase A [Endomicrobiia bacterium]MCL2799882.1 phosphatidylglycerophosphatase A [Endomicrobiia bacterium]